MKEALAELIELMVDIATASENPNHNETEILCQSQPFTPAIQLMNSAQPASKTRCADAGKQRQKRG